MLLEYDLQQLQITCGPSSENWILTFKVKFGLAWHPLSKLPILHENVVHLANILNAVYSDPVGRPMREKCFWEGQQFYTEFFKARE